MVCVSTHMKCVYPNTGEGGGRMDEMTTREPMVIADVAVRLGVSPTRVRQLVSQGVLPAPSELSPRVQVWAPLDVETTRARLRGETVSLHACLMDRPVAPLTPTVDRIMRYTGVTTPGAAVHVRVFTGTGPEGHRTVVLLGCLDESIGFQRVIEDLVVLVADRYLSGDSASALWLQYVPADSHFGQPVRNLVLTYEAPARSRFRRDTDRPALPVPHWRPSSWAELERVVGGSVEAYPRHGYRADVVEAWLRTGAPVDVVYDPDGLRDYVRALVTLDATSDGAVVEDRDVIEWCCGFLAYQAREIERWAYTPRSEGGGASPWDDGTGQGRLGYPATWAARLVPPRISSAERRLIDAYMPAVVDRGLPGGDPDRAAVVVTELQRRIEAVGHFAGDDADPRLREVLEFVERQITGAAESTAPGFRQRTRPPHLPIVFDIAPLDRRYLTCEVTWDQDGELTPMRRCLFSLLSQHDWAGAGDIRPLSFGRDRDGNEVAVVGDPATLTVNNDQPVYFAIAWPTYPRTQKPLTQDAVIVAEDSEERGDLPVYLVDSDGRLTPLPRHPLAPHDGWNFGYSGGGPGALTGALTRLVADQFGDDVAEAVSAWIDDAVCNSDRSHLRIAVADILRRVERLRGN